MIGELLLAIPGIQFAFTEAPSAMKSVLTAFWFINNAFGNLIVVFITELKPVQQEVKEPFHNLATYLTVSSFLVFGVFSLRGTYDGRNHDIHAF